MQRWLDFDLERFVLPTSEEGFTEIVFIDTDDKGALEIAADYKYEASQYKNKERAKADKKRPRILPPGGHDAKSPETKPRPRPLGRARSPRDERRNRSPPHSRHGYSTVGSINRDRQPSFIRRPSPGRRDTDFYDRRRSSAYRPPQDDYKTKSFITAPPRRDYPERDSRPSGYENPLFLSRGHPERPHIDFGRSQDSRSHEYGSGSSWSTGMYARDRNFARPYPDRGYDKYPPRPQYEMKQSSRYESYPKRGGDRPPRY